MSAEDVEVVKGFTSRFEAGDRQVWREHFDPDVVLDMSASGQPAARVYHGHEGVERFFRDWLGTWTDYEIGDPRVHRCGERGGHRVPPERDGPG
jgi:ketosteroid isomerase-like protein